MNGPSPPLEALIPAGGSRFCAVLGWPVEHSLSPAIHAAAFEAVDLDWGYVAIPVEPGGLPRALERLESEPRFVGANVTMPHKEAAAEAVMVLSDDAARLRAVNTVVVGPDGLAGHNTDAPGFARFLSDDAAFDPAGKTALIYGAGGAARACALALARGGVRALRVAVREPLRAVPLLEAILDMPVDAEAVDWPDAPEVEPDLVVNATPVGRAGDALPLPPLSAEVTVVDLLYRPPTTPLLSAARDAGATAFGGLGLLLHQAALSFELWTGRVPPVEAMSAAALAALAAEPD